MEKSCVRVLKLACAHARELLHTHASCACSLCGPVCASSGASICAASSQSQPRGRPRGCGRRPSWHWGCVCRVAAGVLTVGHLGFLNMTLNLVWTSPGMTGVNTMGTLMELKGPISPSVICMGREVPGSAGIWLY